MQRRTEYINQKSQHVSAAMKTIGSIYQPLFGKGSRAPPPNSRLNVDRTRESGGNRAYENHTLFLEPQVYKAEKEAIKPKIVDYLQLPRDE